MGKLADRNQGLGPKSLGVGCLIICLACLTIGSCAAYSTLLYPARMRSVAVDWVETPCLLEKCVYALTPGAGLKAGPGKCLQVEYTYQFAGDTYKSDVVDFVIGEISSMTIEGRDYVRDFPSGSRTVCYVNPENPAEAVLLPTRAAPVGFWLLPVGYLAVGSLPLLLLGFLGFIWLRAGRQVRAKRQRRHSRNPRR